MAAYFLAACFGISCFIAAPSIAAPPGNGIGSGVEPADLKLYESKYYRLYTDVDPERAKEACVRMTRMAEEYHVRTSEFTGDIREKLPFYLYKSADEYYAAGGLANTVGCFNGTRLMAMADPRIGKAVWHVVQHEGFHQFVHAVIGGEIPIWVNEGLAEYFGESIFTGDGFVTGVIPPWRLKRLRKEMATPADEGGLRSVASMMRLSHATWNQEMKIQNYDQAWSMVHFLAQGDNGKYQRAFEAYMRLVSRGRSSEDAWDAVFGDDSAGFERQWRAWWQALPANPTSELYARATVATLTSFLGRAIDQKQSFDSFDEFVHDGEAGSLKMGTQEWLPTSLLSATLRDVARRQAAGETFSLDQAKGRHPPGVIDETNEGLRVAGEAKIDNGKVEQVTVTITGAKHAAPSSVAGSDTENKPDAAADQPDSHEPVREGSGGDP